MGAWMMAAMKAAESTLDTFRARGTARAQNILIDAQNQADLALNEANNRLTAINASFQRVVQSLNNQRQLKAAGEAYNASSSNITRMVDDFTRGGITRQLQASEEMGAVAAQAAATGTGGATQDLIARTAAFQVAVTEQVVSRAQGLAAYDAHTAKASIMSSALEGMDMSPVMETINYLVPQRAKQLLPTYAQGMFNAALSFAGSKDGQQMLASWGSSGPQAKSSGTSGVMSPYLGTGSSGASSSGMWSGSSAAFKI